MDHLDLIESRWREAGCGDGDKGWLIEEVKRLNRALEAIETASFFIDDGISDWDNAPKKQLALFAYRAYAISHSVVRNHSCFHVHDDWRGMVDEMFELAQREGI